MASSYRSFERQKIIWNEKVNGIRPVYNDQNERVDLQKLSEIEKIRAIMRFSALPGFSRHHWGTDIDIFDGNQDHQLELLPSEYEKGGPYFQLSQWIQKECNKTNFAFYLPYQKSETGVSYEPWHLSHKLISRDYMDFYQEVNKSDLLKMKEFDDLALISLIRDHFEDLNQCFIDPYCR